MTKKEADQIAKEAAIAECKACIEICKELDIGHHHTDALMERLALLEKESAQEKKGD